MSANDVIEIVQLFNQNNIDVCIDGGWGVDALHILVVPYGAMVF